MSWEVLSGAPLQGGCFELTMINHDLPTSDLNVANGTRLDLIRLSRADALSKELVRREII